MRTRSLVKHALAIAGALLFLACGVHAQTQTNVTATVTDPLGIPYANGTYSIQLIPSGNNPSVNGQAILGAFNGTTDANGRFNVSLWPNASISPAGTRWQFTICVSPGVLPPLGTGGQCSMPPLVVTIAGASQNLSVALSAVAPALTRIGSSGGGGIISGSGAAPQVAVFTGPTSIGGSAQLTQADGVNALGIFNGPATSTLSANIQGDIAGTGPPEAEFNYHVAAGSPVTSPVGTINAGQADIDVPFIGNLDTFDATNSQTTGGYARFTTLHVNVPVGITNPDNNISQGGGTDFYGAGTASEITGSSFANSNTGSGTISRSFDYLADVPTNPGAGTIVDSIGYWAEDMSTSGGAGSQPTGHTAAFEAKTQSVTSGDHWTFFDDATVNKDKFGTLSADTVTASPVGAAAVPVTGNCTTSPTPSPRGCVSSNAALLSQSTINSITNAAGTSTMTCSTGPINCGLSLGQVFALGLALPTVCQNNGFTVATVSGGTTITFASASCVAGGGPYVGQIGNSFPVVFSFNDPLANGVQNPTVITSEYDNSLHLYTQNSSNVKAAHLAEDATGLIGLENHTQNNTMVVDNSGIDCFGELATDWIGTCAGLGLDNSGGAGKGVPRFFRGLNLGTTGNGFVFAVYDNPIAGNTPGGHTGSIGATTIWTCPASGYGSSSEYTIDMYAVATSSVATSTLQLETLWTDAQGARTDTQPAAPVSFASAGAVAKNSFLVVCQPSQVLQVAVLGVNSPVYSLYISARIK